MTWAGCYSLDLYCDGINPDHKWDEFPHQYTAETGRECREKAQKAGWIIGLRSEKTLCPKCSGRKRGAKDSAVHKS